jgi:hypothetical protein
MIFLTLGTSVDMHYLFKLVRVIFREQRWKKIYHSLTPSFIRTCSDETIAHIFRPAAGCKETISLLKERIAIMRENGEILVKVATLEFLLHSARQLHRSSLRNQNYGGSFANFIRELQQEKSPLTALDVVLKVIEVFPSFRDITTYKAEKVRSHEIRLCSSDF